MINPSSADEKLGLFGLLRRESSRSQPESGTIRQEGGEMERTSQENPANPAGWAIDQAEAAQAGEENAEDRARAVQEERDLAAQHIDQTNRRFEDLENPAQPGGYEYPRTGSVPFTREAVSSHLDDMIRAWRRIRDGERTSGVTPEIRELAPAYIDAFQSIRRNLFGSALLEKKADAEEGEPSVEESDEGRFINRVYVDQEDFEAGNHTGARVMIKDRKTGNHVLGHVLSASEDGDTFSVQWDDGTTTDDESTTDYDLVVREPVEQL
jgi:hypothetical protein